MSKNIIIEENIYNYNELLEKIRNNEFDKKFSIFETQKGYSMKINNSFYCYILRKPAELIIEEKNISKTIYSSKDIEYIILIKSLEKEKLLISYQNRSYSFLEREQYLFFFVEDDKIKLVLKNNEFKKIVQKKALNINSNFTPDDMSEYFYDYFLYQDPNKRKENFIYERSEIRDIIFLNIDFLINKKVQHYKLTGPTSNGKSTTLFVNCCCNENRIYINFKVLKKLINESNYGKCINIIISECSRLNFDDKEIQELNKFIKNNNESEPIKFLYKLLEEISGISLKYKKTVVTVFDQFKKSNYDSFSDFYNLFELLLAKNIYMKVIYCSSINNNEIREEILKNPDLNEIFLTEKNENYYFYYAKIYEIKNNIQNPIFELFNNFPKYIFILQKNGEDKYFDTLKDISNKINTKIELFESNNLQKFISKGLNKSNYYSFLKKYMNIQIDINNYKEILFYFPMKYFILNLFQEYIILSPIFPYLNYVFEKNITRDECYNYFREKKYLQDFQTFRIKADYFEEACKIAIKDQIIELPDNNFKEMLLEEIVSMDNIKESLEDIIQKAINQNKNIINIKNKYKIDKIEKYITKNKFNIFSPLNISEEIFESAIPLEYFRVKEYKIQKSQPKKKTNLLGSVEYSQFSGSENFILDQKDNQGECLDLALLFGEKNKKTFVGIQIKCYNPNKNHNLTKITKYNIKDKIRKVLINSLLLFNCKIISWHYILILYLNNEDYEGEIMNKDVVNHCQRKNIEFIYYDPVKKQFFKNNKKEIYKKLILNDKTNLEIAKISQYDYSKYDTEILNKYKLINYDIVMDDIKGFVQDFDFVGLKNAKQLDNKFYLILDYFLQIFEKKFEFCGKFEILRNKNILNLFPYPLKRNLLILKGLKNEFIGIYNENDNEYIILNISKNKKMTLNELYEKFNKYSNYYYCLKCIDGRYKRSKIDDNDLINITLINTKERITNKK